MFLDTSNFAINNRCYDPTAVGPYTCFPIILPWGTPAVPFSTWNGSGYPSATDRPDEQDETK